MIPRVIHYCWFSGEKKPALMRRCLASWHVYAPNFALKEWTVEALKDRFGELPPFVQSALDAKKWAFASDWARFAVVAAEGGLYLDLDVELIKSLDDLVDGGPFFALSSDEPQWVDPGMGFAAERGDPVCVAMVKRYESLTFDDKCHLSQTCPVITNEVLRNFPDRKLLPAAVFNPKGTCSGSVRIRPETRAVHHFAASWFNWKQRLAYKFLPKIKMDWILKLWFRK